jgi:Uncharacterized conserved protein (COG2071)
VKVPRLRGVIERRILVNYRVDPAALRGVLPAPFRPHLVDNVAIAGICLIRLSAVRPPLVPAALGIASENAAHRIAVEWSDAGVTRRGVYIPRRDSSSRLNRFLGGRFFPGIHHAARFDVREDGNQFRVNMDSATAHVLVDGQVGSALPGDSVFRSMAAASDFFEQGALGYSATKRPGTFDGLELRTLVWRIEPLQVRAVESSFFEDRSHFPLGATAFDCALLMRNVAHEWRARDPLCLDEALSAA